MNHRLKHTHFFEKAATVAIFTLFGNFNYGNKLQSYALQECVNTFGYISETVQINDYDKTKEPKYSLRQALEFPSRNSSVCQMGF